MLELLHGTVACAILMQMGGWISQNGWLDGSE